MFIVKKELLLKRNKSYVERGTIALWVNLTWMQRNVSGIQPENEILYLHGLRGRIRYVAFCV